MIKFQNVSRNFGRLTVLDNVSFAIEKGETFVIIGQSGAGKTTILMHIAGFIDPVEGDVFIDGVKMNGASSSVRARLREKMGFLFPK